MQLQRPTCLQLGGLNLGCAGILSQQLGLLGQVQVTLPGSGHAHLSGTLGHFRSVCPQQQIVKRQTGGREALTSSCQYVHLSTRCARQGLVRNMLQQLVGGQTLQVPLSSSCCAHLTACGQFGVIQFKHHPCMMRCSCLPDPLIA